MSTSEHKRNEDEQAKPSAAAKDTTPPTDKTKSGGDGLKYVFKIAPADPKNSFDFEDVADK